MSTISLRPGSEILWPSDEPEFLFSKKIFCFAKPTNDSNKILAIVPAFRSSSKPEHILTASTLDREKSRIDTGHIWQLSKELSAIELLPNVEVENNSLASFFEGRAKVLEDCLIDDKANYYIANPGCVIPPHHQDFKGQSISPEFEMFKGKCIVLRQYSPEVPFSSKQLGSPVYIDNKQEQNATIGMLYAVDNGIKINRSYVLPVAIISDTLKEAGLKLLQPHL